jgi:hypothetical protein
MKKSFFLFAFLGIIALTGFAQEQEKPDLPPRHLIKTNPFAILSGPIPLTAEFRLGYEHVIAPHRSYLFCASYLNQSPIDWLTKIRSPQTIESGFPVISMSFGLPAIFQYELNNQFHEIPLENGDIIAFGDENRLLKHGIKKILNSEIDTMFQDKRLNLTFRKF